MDKELVKMIYQSVWSGLMFMAGCIWVVIFVGYIKGDIIVSDFQVGFALFFTIMYFFQSTTKKVVN